MSVLNWTLESTFVAECSSVSRWATITGKAFDFLLTATQVLAEGAVAAAVAWTSGLNPGGDPRSGLQVQGDTVQLQGADTASKTLLSGSSAS